MTKADRTMGTRSENQQKKQRQKEFRERKENEERLKAAARKTTQRISKKDDEHGRMHKGVSPDRA